MKPTAERLSKVRCGKGPKWDGHPDKPQACALIASEELREEQDAKKIEHHDEVDPQPS